MTNTTLASEWLKFTTSNICEGVKASTEFVEIIGTVRLRYRQCRLEANMYLLQTGNKPNAHWRRGDRQVVMKSTDRKQKQQGTLAHTHTHRYIIHLRNVVGDKGQTWFLLSKLQEQASPMYGIITQCHVWWRSGDERESKDFWAVSSSVYGSV